MAGILPRRRREKRENESLSIIWTVTAVEENGTFKRCAFMPIHSLWQADWRLPKPPASQPQKIWIAIRNGASQSSSFPLAASKEILFLASFCQLGPVSKHLLSGRGCHEIWGTTLLSLGEKKGCFEAAEESELQRDGGIIPTEIESHNAPEKNNKVSRAATDLWDAWSI